MARLTAVLVAWLAVAAGAMADGPRSAKEALQPFNDLIGTWKATCTPEGTAAERQAGFWIEKVNWEWQFKAGDAWLKLTIDNGKRYKGGELHYQPASDDFRLSLQPMSGPAQTFTGKLAGKKLTMERTEGPEAQRLTITLLHHNRYLYELAAKRPGQVDFSKRWRAGATKEGEAFAAAGSGGPECIVSGGLGTIRVSHKGQTYYVCCTGCRDEFLAEPEKYIREAAEKKKKEK